MKIDSKQRSYRRAAVQEASTAGVMVILYDLLVEDLQGAIRAMGCGDIEERSRQLKHAFLVLQLLEGSLDLNQGGATARSLAAFYDHLRGQLLHAQFSNDRNILVHQIALVLDVREAWSTVDAKLPRNAAGDAPSSVFTGCQQDDPEEHATNRWSA